MKSKLIVGVATVAVAGLSGFTLFKLMQAVVGFIDSVAGEDDDVAVDLGD